MIRDVDVLFQDGRELSFKAKHISLEQAQGLLITDTDDITVWIPNGAIKIAVARQAS